MSPDLSNVSRWFRNTGAAIVLAGCGLAVAFVLLGYNAGAKHRTREGSPAEPSPAAVRGQRSQYKWEPALGNIVILVPEMGFSVTGPSDTGSQAPAIGKRIENQLLGLRQMYQQEVRKKPSLMGSLILQLTVSSSGNVTQVKELTSRLADADFKKAVMIEVYNWKFLETGWDSLTISCPLLFVREGMDVTTVIQWEKALSWQDGVSLVRKLSEAADDSQPSLAGAPFRAAPASANRKPARHDTKKLATKAPGMTHEIKSSAAVRAEPRFAASFWPK